MIYDENLTEEEKKINSWKNSTNLRKISRSEVYIVEKVNGEFCRGKRNRI